MRRLWSDLGPIINHNIRIRAWRTAQNWRTLSAMMMSSLSERSRYLYWWTAICQCLLFIVPLLVDMLMMLVGLVDSGVCSVSNVSCVSSVSGGSFRGKHRKNRESCPTQVTCKVKLSDLSVLSLISDLSVLSVPCPGYESFSDVGKFEYTLPAKFWRLVGCTEMLSW